MFRVSCVGERTRGVDSSVVVRLHIDSNFVTSYYIYALILSPCVREEGRSIKTLNTPMTQTQTLIEVRVLQIVRTVKPIWSRSGNAGLWSSRGSERESKRFSKSTQRPMRRGGNSKLARDFYRSESGSEWLGANSWRNGEPKRRQMGREILMINILRPETQQLS